MYEIPVESTEFVDVQLSSDEDLTASTVELGFAPLDAVSRPAVWLSASWAPGVSNVVRCLYVAGSLEPGEYKVWYRLTDSPESPVRPVSYEVRFI